jgi:hypothetical protein
MFYSLSCQVYFFIYLKKIKLCRREDLLKSLYVLMMSIMSVVYSIICDLGPEIKLITRNRTRSGVRATLTQL